MINTTARSDAFSEFKWEPRSSRFKIVEGNGRGRYISQEAYTNRLNTYIRSQQQQLIGLANEISRGAIDLPTFQRRAARHVAEIHASEVLRFAKDLTNAEQRILLRRVQEQLYAGKDWRTGKSYGVRSLATEIRDGKVSPAQLKARLAAYGEAGRLTAAEVEVSIARRSGKVYGVRRLGSGTHPHCAECPGLQVLVPVAIEKIVLIGDRCSCRVRCRCVILPLDVDEAVRMGMKDPRPAQRRKQQQEKELKAIERLVRRGR